MTRVQGKDTSPEKVVRSWLYRHGYRFRLHRKDLPGSPDVVLLKYQAVIFVHGCFWHRHPGCGKATIPEDNREFWLAKFEKNVARDQRVKGEREALGWRVFVVWGCEIRKKDLQEERLSRLDREIKETKPCSD